MDGSSVTDLGQFSARRGIEMYMCSNTGLSGWAEPRNRTRLCFYTIYNSSHSSRKIFIYCPKCDGFDVARHHRGPVIDCPNRFFLRSQSPALPLDSPNYLEPVLRSLKS